MNEVAVGRDAPRVGRYRMRKDLTCCEGGDSA